MCFLPLLFIHSVIYIGMDSWTFGLYFGHNPVLLHIILLLNLLQFGHWQLFNFCVPLMYPHHWGLCFLFWVFPFYLYKVLRAYLTYILAPDLEPAISSGSPGSFCRTVVLETLVSGNWVCLLLLGYRCF